MIEFVTNFLLFVGAATTGLLCLALIFLGLRKLRKRRIPKGVVLTLDLDQGVAETPPSSPLAKLRGGSSPVLLQVVQAIHHAAQDPRVRALVVRLGSAPLGMSQTQEMRAALQIFAASAKPCLAFAPSFMNTNQGARNYYLATACTKVFLQPSGDLGLCGMEARAFFGKALLERIGVKAQFETRVEYKTAMNMLLEEGLTDPHRESLESITGSFVDQMKVGISEGRSLHGEKVATLFEDGPYSAQEALDHKLIDAHAYEDEVFDSLRENPEERLKTLSVMRYFQKAVKAPRSKQCVALIYGVGPVVDGESGHSFMYRGSSMGDKTLTRAFRAAAKDEEVAAIVFRVDSPGGSYVASDTIWREVCRAQDKGKPVIVSMGDVAGSGGYFVAMPAKYIVAQPGTITGSIGVLAGKLVTREAWARLGVNWETIQTHSNAGMWSDTHEFNPEQHQKLQEMMDRIYADFTGRVGAARKLSSEETDTRARGRIFTGEQALKEGLVDHLGGLIFALDLARKEAGLPEDKEVATRIFPPEPSILEKLARKPATDSQEIQLEPLRRIKALAPIFRTAQMLHEPKAPVTLEMPYPELWTEL